jgi:hypothetical protein
VANKTTKKPPENREQFVYFDTKLKRPTNIHFRRLRRRVLVMNPEERDAASGEP